MTVPLALATLDSPLGPLGLAASDDGLVAVDLPAGAPARREGAARPDHPVHAAAAAQLRAYFAGERVAFDLPLAARGTPFQELVWAGLRAVPYGETRSYGALAAAIGRPGAARAVGAANGRNPLGIVVPCHRVIGGSGDLVGYGGGLPAKRWLLAHEARHAGLFGR
jgi:methylated-DNA-[protein]-cysteine S-methyltransferase